MYRFVDFFAIIVLCSVQGSIVCLVYLIFERLKASAGNICLNYRIVKWIALLYIIPLAYVVDRTFWYNGFLFQSVPSIRWICVLFMILWLAGTIFSLARYYQNYSVVKRIVILSRPCTDERVLECFRQVKQELGIARTVRVRVSEVCHSPFVLGIRKPCIMIPDCFMSTKMLRVIFIHEFIHIKHGDVVWKYVLGLVRCIHWFHPLTAILNHRYEIWSESYNDLVSGRYLDGWKEYFLLMLNMASGESNADSELTASLKEKNSELSERVTRIYKRNTTRRLGAALLTALSVGMASLLSVFGTAKGYEHIYTAMQYRAEQCAESASVWTIRSDDCLPEEITDTAVTWELKPYSRKMTGKSRRVKGSQCYVCVKNMGNVGIEAGFLNSDNEKYYFSVGPHCTVRYIFVIPNTDTYRLYAANWNAGNPVTVSCCYADR